MAQMAGSTTIPNHVAKNHYSRAPYQTQEAPVVAIDATTLMINECMTISSAMRKVSRWSQSGVAAILGAGDIFSEDDSIHSLTTNLNSNNGFVEDNPLLSSFLQLRSILTEAKNLKDVDSLTLLQPFLLVIKSSSTSGNITSLALDSISKFINYGIISYHSKNSQTTAIQIISALTHCRFEAADQNSDDAVLLKVLRLLELIIGSPLSNLLPNEVVSEVSQTCLSLACNKKRSEVLRKAAEMAMSFITIRIFSKLREMETESMDDIQTNFQNTTLPEDTIGGTESSISGIETPTRSELQSAEQKSEEESEAGGTQASVKEEDRLEAPFGIVCINEFLGILSSMISPSNQYQHMESTRVFALSLINTGIEVAGNEIPSHPSLMSLISDSISKYILQIITTTESPALLQASLQLFTTIAVILGRYLKLQVELTFTMLFQSIYPDKTLEKNEDIKQAAISTRNSASKQMLIESLSLLWTRSPLFFTHLFIDYDCDFDRTDLASVILDYLCKLSLPESAKTTSESVPPVCLEGILSFIGGVNERIKNLEEDITSVPVPDLIQNKHRKTWFIECTEKLNEKPKEGIKALVERKFISDENDIDEVARFFFSKSGRLNKKILGIHLSKPENSELLKKFIDLFEFTDLRVDEALRILLKTFRLPGESQQIERIVESFAERYVTCQKDIEGSEEEVVRPDRDSVFVLSYSIIMLNTDLHNPKVKTQMNLEAYKRNLRGIYNGKDFPDWYLSKIYNSIRDREIIMPEEHHGTDKWFDDVWNNLISSQIESTEQHNFNLAQICHFDKILFENCVENLVETLTKVFKEATEDHVITRLMSTVDKCANICMYYNFSSTMDKLISCLADFTTLTGGVTRTSSDDIREEIPITQIKIENKEEAITVSEVAVWFGRDFKAQLSTVVLFRLIKKAECKVSPSWKKIVKIILTLFENCMIDPNLFVDFQKKLKLGPLPKVKPRYIIKKAKLNNSGILSTFSSFLKGYSDEPPEPTVQEIESTLSTIDCVKSVNVAEIFELLSKSEDLKILVSYLVESIPEYSDKTKKFYETEILFLFETIVCFCLLINDNAISEQVLEKLMVKEVSKRGQLRLCTYKLLLSRSSDIKVKAILEEITSFDKETISKYGAAQLVSPLISLIDDDSSCKHLVNDEEYWKALRLLASVPAYSADILNFVKGLINLSPKDINDSNFIHILSLLDEISSLGAIGSQWEQENVGSSESAFYKDVTDISKSSITLTSDLLSLVGRLPLENKDAGYSSIQALAHQGFNPCREVRLFALNTLQSSLISLDMFGNLTPVGLFDFGLFPLIAELSKEEVLQTDLVGFMRSHVEALSLVSKVFLNYCNEFNDDELSRIWIEIIDSFNSLNNISQKFNGELSESGSEILKNMILVLKNNDKIDGESPLWKTTQEKLGQVYPELKDIIVESNTENGIVDKDTEVEKGSED